MRSATKVLYVVSAMSAFFALARQVRQGRTSGLDERITRSIQRIDQPHFRTVMHAVSWPGFPPQSRIIPWVMPLSMLAAGKRLEAIYQLLGWGTGAVSGVVKTIVRRPRPNLPGVIVTPARIRGTSFPSGHVIIYTGVYGTLAYLAHCHIHIKAARRLVTGGLAAMIALVGPSRVYLGHHWFSDVLASYLLGTSYLTVLTSVYQWTRRRSKTKVP
jgi:undecaprenyl-diphosphatase